MKLNFEIIKHEISIVSYLKSIGCMPNFENDHTARFIAPYRADSNPSLSVNKLTNLCFDHGTTQGMNIIQLSALINSCSVYEASRILMSQRESFSFHCNQPISNQPTGIKINKIKKLENIALLQYLQSRAIDIQITQQYCEECYYSVTNKNYFALAFKNDRDGYELRSKYLKGCIGNKNISTISNNSDTLQIFEGFMDMLSFATHYGNEAMLSLDTIVLNSVTNIRKVKGKLANYKKIHLYLDNDNAGRNLAEKLFREFSQVIDCSHLYKNHEDFNDCLISESEK